MRPCVTVTVTDEARALAHTAVETPTCFQGIQGLLTSAFQIINIDPRDMRECPIVNGDQTVGRADRCSSIARRDETRSLTGSHSCLDVARLRRNGGSR